MSSTPATGQLDPSATIGRAIEIYRQNAPTLLPIALGLFAVNALVQVVLQGNAIAGVASLLVSTAVGVIFQGIMTEVARDVEDGTLDSSVGQIISSVTPILVPLVLAAILSAVLVIIGFVFVVVPGLYLAVRFAVVGPVMVVERTGVTDALRRSGELVTGSGWQVFGLILFNIVVGVAVGFIAGIIGYSIAGVVGLFLLVWLISAAVAPVTALVIAVAYLRLRDVHGEAPVPTGAASPKGPLGI